MTLATRAQERVTKGFIDEELQAIVFTRRIREATSAGGKVWKVVGDLPAQDGRKITVRERAENVRTTSDGRTINVGSVLILMPGADVQEGDLWANDNLGPAGAVWEVLYVSRDPSWRTQVEIVRYAS